MDPDHLGRERSWLRRQAHRLIGPKMRRWTDSEDLAHMAHVEAQRDLEGRSFANRRAFRGWLRVILGRLASREGRREGGIEVIAAGTSRLPGRGRSPSQGAALADSGRWLRERIEGLPPRDKRVVLMRVVEDQPFGTIAARLSISEGNARVIFHRALKRLREECGAREPDRG